MERRFKMLPLSHQNLISILSPTGGRFCLRDFPSDTMIHSVYYDQIRMVFMVILRSDSFDIVPEGEVIPILNTVCVIVDEPTWRDQKPLL